MPNWCNNSLTITGDVDTLSQLKPVLEKGEGLLEAIKPIGEWDYGTAVEAWGTKWDVSTEGLEFTDNGDGTATISGWFDSAWGPPIDAFQALADDWDSCYIELFYEEGGMAMVGCWDSEGADDHYEYGDFNSKNVRDNIPEYLLDFYPHIEEYMAEWEEENDEKVVDTVD